jgi:hypothetical protein
VIHMFKLRTIYSVQDGTVRTKYTEEQRIFIYDSYVKSIHLVYVVENFNKNSLVLIFLQCLQFIIWLINSKLRVRTGQDNKKKTPRIDWRISWRYWCKIGAFAKKITNKTSPESWRFGLLSKNHYNITETSSV